MTKPTGPLHGLRILELASIGPVPFCGMLFSDLGADVLRIDRPGGRRYDRYAVETRGRRSLVYGRMTGFGQTGPHAKAPGHDINYVALSGALHALGPREQPAVPLNLIGEFGGGALYLAFGIMAALRHAVLTGEGQVVDCAMTEGAISIMGMLYGEYAAGRWRDEREGNIIDGGAHFYNVYECADGKWISVAAMEPPFYSALLGALGLDGAAGTGQTEHSDFTAQIEQSRWPELKLKLARLFKTRTRDEPEGESFD